jgi:hypothetical protein
MAHHNLRFEILKVVNASTTVFLNVTNTLQSLGDSSLLCLQYHKNKTSMFYLIMLEAACSLQVSTHIT